MIQAARHFRLTLDPWPPDYESAVAFETPAEEAAGDADTSVEGVDWAPIRPDSAPPVRQLCFVDGVRRVEARVLGDDNGTLRHGLLGSFATGAVVCGGEKAGFERIGVQRLLVLSGEARDFAPLPIGGATVAFQSVATAASTPDDILAAFQRHMREAEARLGESLAAGGRPVIVDGPLSYVSSARRGVTGLIKRIQLPYLAAAEFSLVPRLGTGERTPLFAIGERYSWFLRLAEGRAIEHAFAGIVRLEISAAAGLEEARAAADFSAWHLPLFASSAIRDPRAPQNLVPVGALEEELRRRLGDPLLIRRAIERRLFEEARA